MCTWKSWNIGRFMQWDFQCYWINLKKKIWFCFSEILNCIGTAITWNEICFLNSFLCIIFQVPNISSTFIPFCCCTSFVRSIFLGFDWIWIFDFFCFSRSSSRFAVTSPWTHTHTSLRDKMLLLKKKKKPIPRFFFLF